MNNYEYIIASLPVPEPNFAGQDAPAILDFIKSQCTAMDCAYLECLENAFKSDNLDSAFYEKALASKNNFIKEFLRFDLLLRNTKVEYLNRVLERPEGMDLVPLPGHKESESPEYDEKPAVSAVLEQEDILARERGLDKLLWDKADELSSMRIFDMDVILAFTAKILITERWNKLDPATGRELFRKLVQEIRNTR